MHTNTAEFAWDSLRARRWNPPGAAGSTDERRLTYQTSLQQSEELFSAAARVSTAAAPLSIFYALSQGCRAIAAAARGAAGDRWKLNGHGIKAKGLDGSLPEVTVSTDPEGRPGSFVRLSELLGSPVWGRDVAISFRELWDTLPINSPDSQALDDELGKRRTPIVLMPLSHREPHPLALGVLNGLPVWLPKEPDPKAALETYLSDYPGAGGYDSYHLTYVDHQPAFEIGDDGWASVRVNWRVPGEEHLPGPDRNRYVQSRARLHNDEYYFFPRVAELGASLHPLMAWWAVLYVLSMVARYQPAAWSTQLDINASRYAYPVETVLGDALMTLPSLIAEAVEQVSQPSAP
jgi:hypothetical protein